MSGYISKTYRYDLDVLKDLAIIAEMLYHAGWSLGHVSVQKNNMARIDY